MVGRKPGLPAAGEAIYFPDPFSLLPPSEQVPGSHGAWGSMPLTRDAQRVTAATETPRPQVFISIWWDVLAWGR